MMAGWSKALACSFWFILMACEDPHLLTGRYMSDSPITLDGAQIRNMVLTLDLGHYGPDVAGLIRFYEEVVPVPPGDGLCNCRLLFGGRYSGGVLRFYFYSRSKPCQNTPEPLDMDRVIVELESSNGGQVLDGSLWMESDKRENVRLTLHKESEYEPEPYPVCPQDSPARGSL